MSVIYYCDAPSCGNKQLHNSQEHPPNWVPIEVDGKLYDACSEAHAEKLVEVHTPPPKPKRKRKGRPKIKEEPESED